MKQIFLFLGLALAACNSGQPAGPSDTTHSATNDSTTGSVSGQPLKSMLAGCFNSIYNRDTAGLRLEEKGGNISGALSYNYFEKDRNEGSFQGELRGDILSGWYLFKSEGILSVRQVAWKVRGDQLWPASGEMMQRNDTALFKDVAVLNYDSIRVFKKVPCTL